MGNIVAKRAVLKAINKIEQKNPPFLHLNPNDSYFFLKAIYNELSPISTVGFFLHERSIPVEKSWYAIGLAYEKKVVFKKLKIIVASEDLLKQVQQMENPPLFEDSVHQKRWTTLKKMSQIYFSNGCNHAASCLWKIELAFPVWARLEQKF